MFSGMCGQLWVLLLFGDHWVEAPFSPFVLVALLMHWILLQAVKPVNVFILRKQMRSQGGEYSEYSSGHFSHQIELEQMFSPRGETNKFRLQNLLNAKEKNSPGSITDLMCRLMGLDTKLTGNCHSCRASSHHQQMSNTWGGQSEAGVKVSSLSFKCCRWNCKVQRFSWEGNQLEI